MKTVTIGQSYGTVGASLNAHLSGIHAITLSYDFTYRSKYKQHTLSATYGISF